MGEECRLHLTYSSRYTYEWTKHYCSNTISSGCQKSKSFATTKKLVLWWIANMFIHTAIGPIFVYTDFDWAISEFSRMFFGRSELNFVSWNPKSLMKWHFIQSEMDWRTLTSEYLHFIRRTHDHVCVWACVFQANVNAVRSHVEQVFVYINK